MKNQQGCFMTLNLIVSLDAWLAFLFIDSRICLGGLVGIPLAILIILLLHRENIRFRMFASYVFGITAASLASIHLGVTNLNAVLAALLTQIMPIVLYGIIYDIKNGEE